MTTAESGSRNEVEVSKKETIELVSLAEAARRTETSRQTLHRMVERGQLQTYRVRRRNGFLSSAYVQWPLTAEVRPTPVRTPDGVVNALVPA